VPYGAPRFRSVPGLGTLILVKATRGVRRVKWGAYTEGRAAKEIMT